MSESHEIGSSYKCDRCGKTKEVPIWCNLEEYGWRTLGKRFCSYSCMRAYETKYKRNKGSELNQKNGISRLEMKHNTFRKLEKYEARKAEGVSPSEAADMAGFVSYDAAIAAERSWLRSEEYQTWIRGVENV